MDVLKKREKGHWSWSEIVARRTPANIINVPRYPPKLIPGINIFVCTTATNDRDARLLLSSMGVPFYGKHVN